MISISEEASLTKAIQNALKIKENRQIQLMQTPDWISCLHCMKTKLSKWKHCLSKLLLLSEPYLLQTWLKSLTNFPKFIPTTWSLWPEQGRKRRLERKAASFFMKAMFTMSACQQSEDFYIKACSFRLLGKSEEPHFLSIIFAEKDDRAQVFKAVSVKEKAVHIVTMCLLYSFC